MSNWTAASSDCGRDDVHIRTADLYRPNARFTPERQRYQVLTPFGKLGYSRFFCAQIAHQLLERASVHDHAKAGVNLCQHARRGERLLAVQAGVHKGRNLRRHLPRPLGPRPLREEAPGAGGRELRLEVVERLTTHPEPLADRASRIAVYQMRPQHLVADLQVVLSVEERRPPLEQRIADAIRIGVQQPRLSEMRILR